MKDFSATVRCCSALEKSKMSIIGLIQTKKRNIFKWKVSTRYFST